MRIWGRTLNKLTQLTSLTWYLSREGISNKSSANSHGASQCPKIGDKYLKVALEKQGSNSIPIFITSSPFSVEAYILWNPQILFCTPSLLGYYRFHVHTLSIPFQKHGIELESCEAAQHPGLSSSGLSQHPAFSAHQRKAWLKWKGKKKRNAIKSQSKEKLLRKMR